MDCTDVGGSNSIGAEFPPSLYVVRGSVVFEVCDDEGCESATKKLGRLPRDPAVGRASSATFSDLGRSFEPGAVRVSVELRGPEGDLVAYREQEVELTRYWPNGKACDGDGYVGGGLKLRSSDRV